MRYLLWSVTVLLSMATVGSAQNMRVYTSVTDYSRDDAPAKTISHSLTLFHAGKVYDYMEEVGEVVIFEPTHSRFIILGNNFAATEVPFAELNHFLDSAQKKSVEYINELNEQQTAAAQRKAAAVHFQMQPDLSETIDSNASTIHLRGGHLNYFVKCSQPETPQDVNRYLEYANWAARLNYVLHPHSAFPAARLQLNQRLEEKGWLPVKVELSMHLDSPVKLRAEHSYTWEFQSVDRLLISRWEKTLQSDKVRWLTFHEYQQQLLTAQTR